MRGEQARPDARRGDGACAYMEGLRRLAEIGLDLPKIQLAQRAFAARGLDEKVQNAGLAAGRVHGQKPAAQQRGKHRLCDDRGQRRGDDGVHGVAARAQHFGRGVGGQFISGGDGPAIRHGKRNSAAGARGREGRRRTV